MASNSPQGGTPDFKQTGMIEGFFGFEIFDSRIFLGRKIWQVFFGGYLDLSRDFLVVFKTIGRFVVEPPYPSRRLQMKYNQTCFAVVLCICFRKPFIVVRKVSRAVATKSTRRLHSIDFSSILSELNFGPGIFLGCVGSHRDFFWF